MSIVYVKDSVPLLRRSRIDPPLAFQWLTCSLNNCKENVDKYLSDENSVFVNKSYLVLILELLDNYRLFVT